MAGIEHTLKHFKLTVNIFCKSVNVLKINKTAIGFNYELPCTFTAPAWSTEHVVYMKLKIRTNLLKDKVVNFPPLLTHTTEKVNRPEII